MTPIQASLRKNEGYVYKNFLDKSNKITPKFQINDLVRTADLKRTFSKGDTTNWSYKLYKITEIINDTIPSYKIDNLEERYNQSLLKKTELSLKQNKDVMKASNLTRSTILCPSLLIEINLFVKTNAYPYIPAGMFSENLNSTFTG